MINQQDFSFKHDINQNRFILSTKGGDAFVSYSWNNNTMHLNHSEVPSALRGQGVGKQLIIKTFEYIEQHQIKAIALCTYIILIKNRIPKWNSIIG